MRLDITDPRVPKWIFWLVTVLICALIGLAIGALGTFLVHKFIS